jgi:hypothetical protein
MEKGKEVDKERDIHSKTISYIAGFMNIYGIQRLGECSSSKIKSNDVSKRSTAGQTSSSKSKNKIIVLPLGSILALAIIGTWTMDVQELFVIMTINARTSESKRPII